MIRKWLKINTCFLEILKNSVTPKNLEKKWAVDSTCKHYISCCSLYSSTTTPIPNTSASTGNIRRQSYSSLPTPPPPPLQTLSDPKEKGDAESVISDSDDSVTAVAETPASTELFEVKGPDGSAFLIEVEKEDLECVKSMLIRLKGDIFQFDRTVIGYFTVKCVLTAEPGKNPPKDQARLAKIHAISSGCEEVYGCSGKFFFVNSVNKTMRAKRILEKFGYSISGISYRFQPKQKISLNDRLKETCNEFVMAVERLPKVISVTHNL